MAILTCSRRILYTGIAAMCLLAHGVALADNLELQEQEIKAGLLYNFLKYIDWPGENADAGAPKVNVCVFGGNPFNGYLQPLGGRTVNKKEITLHLVSLPTETDQCHLLFINAARKDEWPRIRQYITGKSILTVSDFNTFAESGGMIEFGRKDEHINVTMNMAAMDTAHLRVQERLLKLVHVIYPGGAGQAR